jgi:hypothetical protein
METQFIVATLFNLSVNLLYTLLSLLVGVIALKFVDQQLLRNVDIEKQLQDGNIAVSIFASTILLFVAVIVSFGLKG